MRTEGRLFRASAPGAVENSPFGNFTPERWWCKAMEDADVDIPVQAAA
jgi:hypothetical protein